MAENTENKTLMIPLVASESSMDRLERSNHRMFIIIVLLIIGLVISNSIWLYNWMQYDYVDTFEVDVGAEGDGIANYNCLGISIHNPQEIPSGNPGGIFYATNMHEKCTSHSS